MLIKLKTIPIPNNTNKMNIPIKTSPLQTFGGTILDIKTILINKSPANTKGPIRIKYFILLLYSLLVKQWQL